MRGVLPAVLVGVLVAAPVHVRAADDLAVWAADPHVKVFRDAAPPSDAADGPAGVLRLRAARNEVEPAQFVFRCGEPMAGARVEVSSLRHGNGRALIEGENVRWNFVGFIPLEKNTRESEAVWVRRAPCEVPDPLLETRTLDVKAGQAQPVWLTVRVPPDAAAGLYRGEAAVVAGDRRVAVPVELTVDPFVLPDARHLFVTNWFSPERIGRQHKVEPWSEGFWPLLERYARNMAAHRQNVVLVRPSLVDMTREADGRLSFDYARFDRFVETFEKAGAADRIEIGHVGGFGQGGWGSKEIVLRGVTATDRKTGKRVSLTPDEGLAPLLADLQKHLAERGWLEKAMIHVADEPAIHNAASWRKASAFVHAAAPRLRRIDAIEGTDFDGALEVWVPKLSHFDRWRTAYDRRRGHNEFWFYICCHPYGNVYPNRFLDYPLSRVRVLHWINYTADLPGYLHWGLAAWGDDPFGVPAGRLPPGDTHVIYPGRQGPLDSIRWEIQRDSIEDYEYLRLLEAKTAAVKARLGEVAAWIEPRRRAMELARRVVPDIANCETDPAAIVAVRQAVADEIIALDTPPLLVVQTEPPEGATLVNGPINVEVRGAASPGAAVSVNGRPVEVGRDGTFAVSTRPAGDAYTITVEAKEGERQRTAVRHFRLEK